MALVINPLMSGQASGKVGSIVASRNRNGAYIRQNGKPVQPRTPSQTAQRYSFARMENLFLALTTANVDLWNDFGNNYTVPNRLGNASNITGLNWFIALNTRLDRAGFATASTPPINPLPTFNPAVSVAQTAGGGAINLGLDVSMAATSATWVYATGNLTRTRRFKSQSMRLVSIFTVLSQAVNHPIVPAANLSLDDSSVQVEIVNVDASGRATAPLRFTIFPVT